MSKKKNKFDLSHLIQSGLVKEGDTFYFVSDTKMTCVVKKMPNHEYKVECGKETITVHAAAVKFLGQEPPEHATRWLRTTNGKTLYELWQSTMEMEEVA